jgi:sugar fermentation stimulation protein A
MDLHLSDPDRPPCAVEIKSVTLVKEGIAYFPDAITERGTRHVRDLAHWVSQGGRAALVYLVTRSDATCLRPADRIDRDYGRELRRAARRGVEVYAYGCRFTPAGAVLAERVPVDLTGAATRWPY